MNTETKHTPGPYSISGIAGDHHIMAMTPNGRRNVAIVVGFSGISDVELEANKELFRSAPDMAKEIALLRMDNETMRDSLKQLAQLKADKAELLAAVKDARFIMAGMDRSPNAQNWFTSAKDLIAKHSKV